MNKPFIYSCSFAAGALIVAFGKYISQYGLQGLTWQSLFSTSTWQNYFLIPTWQSYFSSFAFHPFIGFAIAISLSAPSLLIHLENRRKRLIDNALPRLLEDIAESQEAGMTLLQSLEESSRRNYGPITDELKKLTSELSWGADAFERAFKAFSERIGTELSIRTTTLILEAVKLGGDLKTTFNSTAKFVRQIIQLRDERESQLRAYLIVIYASSIIFVAVILILYRSFFIPMASQPTQFLGLTMSLEGYKSLLFDLALVEAIFGGLTGGKLSQGVTLNGLKHSVILVALASAALTFLF